MEKIKSLLFGIIKYLTLASLLGILALIIVRDRRIDYLYKNMSFFSNAVIVAIIALATACIYFWQKKKSANISSPEETPKKRRYMGIIFASLGLLVIELIVARNIYLDTGWDCGSLTEMARSIAFYDGSVGNDTYFSQHPNNMMLTAVLTWLLKIFNFLGFKGESMMYFPMVFGSVMMVNLSGIFTFDLVRIFTGSEKKAWGAWGVFAVWIGLNPWICIPYSDTYSILFPILIIWIYEKVIRKYDDSVTYALGWLIAALFAFFGYMIKPTVLLAFISIVIVEIIDRLFGSKGVARRLTLNRLMFIVLGALVGYIICLLINLGAMKLMGATPDEDQSFVMPHYIYMGLNYDTCGTYHQPDNNFTAGFPDQASRKAGDIEGAKERIRQMGLRKFLVHMERKSLVNFNDGTFSWGNEGAFYRGIIESDSFITGFFRNIYYSPEVTKTKAGEFGYRAFHTIAQFIWVVILILMSLSILKKDEKTSPAEVAARLSILAIILFVSIFEARARYLYLYAPLMVVLAFNYRPFLKRLKSDKA